MKVLLLKDPKDKESGPDPYVKVSELEKVNGCVILLLSNSIVLFSKMGEPNQIH